LGESAAQTAATPAQVAAVAPDANAAAAASTTAPASGETATDSSAASTNTLTLADVTTRADGEGGSVTRDLGAALSLNRLRAQFFNGMRFTAALFFGVAAIYAGKRLFDWVWKQYS
jgi:hypothetical protein